MATATSGEGLGAAIAAAEAYVKVELDGNDASHDYWHIHRVRNLAITLAKQEGLDEHQVRLVELAALLHDVKDWKYSGCAAAGPEAVTAFLAQQEGIGAEDRDLIQRVVKHIGFKEELGGGKTVEMFPELAVVQDADRLDAIGAIGVARCLTFGGNFKRVLYDPAVEPRVGLTKEQYMSSTVEQTTINHFHEKLLLIKDLMKTKAGSEMAEERHAFMLSFLEKFHSEWDGRS